jgi:hypothetical protein
MTTATTSLLDLISAGLLQAGNKVMVRDIEGELTPQGTIISTTARGTHDTFLHVLAYVPLLAHFIFICVCIPSSQEQSSTKRPQHFPRLSLIPQVVAGHRLN